MSEAADNRDAHIAQLASLTGLDPAQAQGYLDAANGDPSLAAELFFDQAAGPQDGAELDDDDDMAGDEQAGDADAPPQQQPVPGGGRTLGGAHVPPSADATSSAQPTSSRQPPARGMRTLKDLQSSSSGQGHGHGDDGESDDEDPDADKQDFFAGGEKSGLAVQNPNQAGPHDHINNILKRARQYVD